MSFGVWLFVGSFLVVSGFDCNSSAASSLSLPFLDSLYITPRVVLFLEQGQESPNDVICLLHRFIHVNRTVLIQENPCVELVTEPANLGEYHILLMKNSRHKSMCRPKVFGPIPDVLQIYVPPINNNDEDDYLTMKLTSKGGNLTIDVDMFGNGALHNLAIMLKHIFKISHVSSLDVNKIRPFIRTGQQDADQEQVHQINEMNYKIKNKDSTITVDTIMVFWLVMTIVYAVFVAYIAGADQIFADKQDQQQSVPDFSVAMNLPVLDYASLMDSDRDVNVTQEAVSINETQHVSALKKKTSDDQLKTAEYVPLTDRTYYALDKTAEPSPTPQKP